MGKALYRKYRSRSLDEVIGQEHVTELLARAIAQGRIAHAYLFTGPKGVGKTSIARILAHEINGLPYSDEETHLDIIEIDAASNNGVEDIRDLRDRVQIAPVSASKKVYIIDEVHMLSKQAFNALLKTLEEPPEHVVFILATTDVDKVPETILSRTQRHSFRRASEKGIITNLQRIAKAEKVTADSDALKLIARQSDGSFRDSVSLFDQLTSGNEKGKALSADMVRSSLGLAEEDYLEELLGAVLAGNLATINTKLLEIEHSGMPARTIAGQLTHLVRERMTETPALVALLDTLLEVNRSAYPELKLLTTLSLFAVPAPSAPSISVPIAAQAPQTQKRAEASTLKTKSVPVTVTEAPKAISKPAKKPVPSAPFDWEALLAYVRANHVALHSVLSKCQPLVEDGVIRLYTGSAFYKKKLDDSKYRALLANSLAEIGSPDYEIETSASKLPLKDSQAAKVAAIMGGGEEVSVDDASK